MTDSAKTAATGAETTAEDARTSRSTEADDQQVAGGEAVPATSTPDGGTATTHYRERLYLPWYHWILPLVAAGLLAAEVHMGYPGVRAWLPYLITVPLTLLLLWRFGNAKVEIRDGELFAGEAHLPAKFFGEIQIVPASAKRKVLGPGFDPAAFALHRGWIGPMVFIELTDPADPTPYWLISTRAPERLVAKLDAIREAERPAEDA